MLGKGDMYYKANLRQNRALVKSIYFRILIAPIGSYKPHRAFKKIHVEQEIMV